MPNQHTQGPWIAVNERKKDRSLVTGIIQVEGDTNRWICRISDNPDIDFEQEQANARLISAAPELLTCVKASLEMFNAIRPMVAIAHPDLELDMARAARTIVRVLAKAGEKAGA